MNVVIVLPTYNEKGNIVKLIPILEEKVFPEVKNHKMSILVVDDNSPDGTADEVRNFMKRWKNVRLNLGQKQGLGAAYIRGMQYAIDEMDANVMFEMDADFFHDPNKIPIFIRKIEEGFDMAIGTRYSDGGSIPSNWGIDRKIYSVIGNLLVRSILMRFYLHDWTGGYRALKKEVFLKEKNALNMYKGYTFQVAFLHKAVADGFKVAEVPFYASDRTYGRSKFAPAEYIFNLLKYVIIARSFEIIRSPFPKYFVTGFVGYLINAISLEIFKTMFGLPSGLAGSMGAELSIISNFLINNFWSFSSQRITNPIRLLSKFLEFNLISFGSLVIIGISLSVTTYLFEDTRMVRQLTLFFSIPFLVIPYSYSMYNIFIWKRWRVKFWDDISKKSSTKG